MNKNERNEFDRNASNGKHHFSHVGTQHGHAHSNANANTQSSVLSFSFHPMCVWVCVCVNTLFSMPLAKKRFHILRLYKHTRARTAKCNKCYLLLNFYSLDLSDSQLIGNVIQFLLPMLSYHHELFSHRHLYLMQLDHSILCVHTQAQTWNG